jgi:hypothetical protein
VVLESVQDESFTLLYGADGVVIQFRNEFPAHASTVFKMLRVVEKSY